MKSTKNLLVMGLALTIALCTSVQITAMAKEENHYLSSADKETLRDALYWKNKYLDSGKKKPSEMLRKTIAQKEAIESILYGNQPYSKDDIHAAIYE